MKKLARSLCSLLLKFSLFSLALLTALVMVFGTPDQLKRSLEESGIYDGFVDSVLQASAADPGVQVDSFPLDNPEIQQAAREAFPPSLLQKNFEQAIDGTYSWLDGETDRPAFALDFTDAKQTFANKVGDYSVNRFNSLPACTLRQLQNVSSQFDAFTIPCRPPGLAPADVRRQVVNEIARSEAFLDETVVTAETLGFSAGDNVAFAPYAGVPRAVQQLRLAPAVLAGVSALLAAAIVLLYDSKRRALRSLSATFAGTGLFVLISTLLLSYLFAEMNKPGGPAARAIPGEFQQATVATIQSLGAAMNSYLMEFSVGYILLGAVGFAFLYLTRDRATGQEGADSTMEPYVPETTQLEAPELAEAEKTKETKTK